MKHQLHNPKTKKEGKLVCQQATISISSPSLPQNDPSYLTHVINKHTYIHTTAWCCLEPYPFAAPWCDFSELLDDLRLRTITHVITSRHRAIPPSVEMTAMYAFFHLSAGFNMLKPLKMLMMLRRMTVYPTEWWYTFQYMRYLLSLLGRKSNANTYTHIVGNEVLMRELCLYLIWANE